MGWGIVPQFMTGRFSGEAIDGRRTDGRYFQFEWLRFVNVVEFGAVPKWERK
jgi:hypothetical protein